MRTTYAIEKITLKTSLFFFLRKEMKRELASLSYQELIESWMRNWGGEFPVSHYCNLSLVVLKLVCYTEQ